ncbi:MAG: hypothetical protein B7Z60_02685 [Ferrovum sp. 37-45-19]|uniref:hypothetical protein n=1 Tax=Ferrovum sp. JA12 TaxID=1356299 RepID=UPI0007038386|nr:hypothetical protein [Ferrovum sp. JA12]OYV80369.1 MAG: hypothetical protein B7Z65_02190 [Ferrovum sp. 21-44-67]OYV95113.1 MAG: hypothetical protein B7Z60_02685 [Ferrovum sp. 37-45-19]HQT80821.1 hypothetical protein [Ferrovaceae bacterium]KRH78663.1 hypothetical protein FERRO_16560 [Ferrovum sp. JA12]HQU06561.1 hypothetical protein [Ferrovaceae bacterium]
MQRKIKNSTWLLTLSSLVLVNCGGGSGNVTFCGYDAFGNPYYCSVPNTTNNNPTPVASTLTFQLTPAFTQIATTPFSYTVNATDGNGNNFSYTYSSVPQAGTTQFNNQSAISAVVTTTLTENGSSLNLFNNQATNTLTRYFNPTTYSLLGTAGLYPGSFSTVTSTTSLPATGLVGFTSNYITANLFNNSQQTISDGTLAETFSINANTVSTALLCYNDTPTLTTQGTTDGLTNYNQNICFNINSSGQLQGMQVTIPINGVPLTFY